MTEPRRTSTTVFVRGLSVAARIGVYEHEEGRDQPLIIDADLEIETDNWSRLSETVNYERVGVHARAIAEKGHIGLVETFAHRLARRLPRGAESDPRAHPRGEAPRPRPARLRGGGGDHPGPGVVSVVGREAAR